jgi:putative PIN family toxin of toxin-antitoxin system
LIRVVLDTNVFISGIVFNGIPRQILEHIIKGKIQCSVSEEILYEVNGVLAGKKFKYPPHILRMVIYELESVTELVIPEFEINIIEKDPSDNRILECAVTAGVEYIISGDSQLLELKEFEGIPILKPADFLSLFQ